MRVLFVLEEIVGLADDMAVAVIAKNLVDVEVYAMESVRAVKSWLKRSGLTLVDGGPESVLITKPKKKNTVTVGGYTVTDYEIPEGDVKM